MFNNGSISNVLVIKLGVSRGGQRAAYSLAGHMGYGTMFMMCPLSGTGQYLFSSWSHEINLTACHSGN